MAKRKARRRHGHSRSRRLEARQKRRQARTQAAGQARRSRRKRRDRPKAAPPAQSGAAKTTAKRRPARKATAKPRFRPESSRGSTASGGRWTRRSPRPFVAGHGPARLGRAHGTAGDGREHGASIAGMTDMAAGDLDVDVEEAYFSGDEAPAATTRRPTRTSSTTSARRWASSIRTTRSSTRDKVAERDKHRWELDPGVVGRLQRQKVSRRQSTYSLENLLDHLFDRLPRRVDQRGVLGRVEG